MSDTKQVVVYGASGYTGRLVCEYLREFNVPFIAAGRDKAGSPRRWRRCRASGPSTTRSSRSSTTVGPLSELFDGAAVVCNMVGPFATYGAEVVEACLATGCHYLDTTGEQDWLIAARGRLRRPDGGGGPAAGARHRPDVHHRRDRRPALPGDSRASTRSTSLVFWKGAPTVASTRTILVNAALAKAYYLEQNALRGVAGRRRPLRR